MKTSAYDRAVERITRAALRLSQASGITFEEAVEIIVAVEIPEPEGK